MIDPNHLFTLHHTYTGSGCALCGKDPQYHPNLSEYMKDGTKLRYPDISGVSDQHAS